MNGLQTIIEHLYGIANEMKAEIDRPMAIDRLNITIPDDYELVTKSDFLEIGGVK